MKDEVRFEVDQDTEEWRQALTHGTMGHSGYDSCASVRLWRHPRLDAIYVSTHNKNNVMTTQIVIDQATAAKIAYWILLGVD